MNSTSKGIRLSLLCALSLLPVCGATVLSGCAAAPGSARGARPLPASPQQGRQEIASLQQHIEQLREQLGLPARVAESATTSLTPEPDSRSPEDTMVSPSKPASSPPSRERSERDESADGDATAKATADDAESKRCRYTRAICHAAERICRIADYLGDADARSRCQRARDDCRQARQLSGC